MVIFHSYVSLPEGICSTAMQHTNPDWYPIMFLVCRTWTTTCWWRPSSKQTHFDHCGLLGASRLVTRQWGKFCSFSSTPPRQLSLRLNWRTGSPFHLGSTARFLQILNRLEVPTIYIHIFLTNFLGLCQKILTQYGQKYGTKVPSF